MAKDLLAHVSRTFLLLRSTALSEIDRRDLAVSYRELYQNSVFESLGSSSIWMAAACSKQFRASSS